MNGWATFEELRSHYFRYYHTQFRIRDQRVRDQIDALLNRDGGVWRDPWLELRPPYQSSVATLQELLPADIAEIVASSLWDKGPDFRPYTHQADSLVGAGEGDLLITGGTGSGKTKAFLLPVFASLVKEAQGWTPSNYAEIDQPWWEGEWHGQFVLQRQGEDAARRAAIRCLIAYPTNALVEDQLTTLRRAARVASGHLGEGRQLFFGRYNGRTQSREVVADPGRDPRFLRQWLKGVTATLDGLTEGSDQLDFVPAIYGSEMRSRQDMYEFPPDIMVTNFSMLQLMLARDSENGIWDKTRDWIAESDENVFWIVVDEIHTQRGTGGTEVAYLLRALKHRLGLDKYPERLRCIGVSASLQNDASAISFARQFFGRDGLPETTLVRAKPDWEALSGVEPEPIRSRLISTLRDGDNPRPVSVPQLVRELIGDSTDEWSPSLVYERAERWKLPLRTHLFFRAHPGLWACSNSSCPGGAAGSGIGRVHGKPALSCSVCGSRVLELLYCRACGVTLLGGWTQRVLDDRGQVASLFPQPRRTGGSRRADRYRVFCPKVPDRSKPEEWQATREDRRLLGRWMPASLGHDGHSVRTRPNNPEFNGWFYEVTEQHKNPDGTWGSLSIPGVPAIPVSCPACEISWEKRYQRPEAPGARPKLAPLDDVRLNSPIRPMAPSFRRITQVLMDRMLMLSDDPSGERTIVFSDSRQEAARLAGDLERDHWSDLARSLVLDILEERQAEQSEVRTAFEACLKVQGVGSAPAATDTDFQLLPLLIERRRDLYDWVRSTDGAQALAHAVWVGGKLDLSSIPDGLRSDIDQPPMVSLDLLDLQLAEVLLACGACPVGPHPERLVDGHPRPWWEDLSAAPAGSSPAEADLRLLRGTASFGPASLKEEITDLLAAGAGRSPEQLGLALIVPSSFEGSAEIVAADIDLQAALACLRLMIERRRVGIEDSERYMIAADGDQDLPSNAKRYTLELAMKQGRRPDCGKTSCRNCPARRYCAEAASLAFDAIVRPHLSDCLDTDNEQIQFSRLALLPAWNLPPWVCRSCQERTLHACAGVCPRCRNSTMEEGTSDETTQNYFLWLARQRLTGLRTEELTAQQGASESRDRQLAFLGVGTRHRREPEINVLSVTTTMEAGVDIGELSSVVMANMPPQRFNYQQRVGRAGRSGAPTALALTIARQSRSHDAAHFYDPARMISERVRDPFVDMRFESIAHRCLALWAVREACLHGETLDTADTDTGVDDSEGQQGELGVVDGWETQVRPRLETWLADPGLQPDRERLIGALVTATALTTEQLSVWMTTEMLPWIDQAIEACLDHARVSTRLHDFLAENGRFPLYGMPSNSRTLYLSEPARPGDLRESDRGKRTIRIVRDPATALSEFVFGRQLVVSKWRHTVAGIVDYLPNRGAIDPVLPPEDTLGDSEFLSVCRSCQRAFVLEDLSDAPGFCENCGTAEPDSYRELRAVRPRVFRTTYEPKEYSGSLAWAPTPLPPVLMDPGEEPGENIGIRAQIRINRSPDKAVYIINDNDGQDYRLRKGGDPRPGFSRPPSRHATSLLFESDGFVVGSRDAPLVGEPMEVALAHKRFTDVLRLSAKPNEAHGSGFDLTWQTMEHYSKESRTAAWISFSHLLRQSAAELLDVSSGEFQSHISTYGFELPCAPGGQRVLSAEAFLADSLDNGAGYASYFESASRRDELLESVEGVIRRFERPDHDQGSEAVDRCTSSCYDCLSEYTNQWEQTSLDWRLARDLFLVLSAGTWDRERTGSHALEVASRVAEGAGMAVPELRQGGLSVMEGDSDHPWVVCHPLDPQCGLHRTDELRSVVQGLLAEGAQPRLIDWFSLRRDPAEVVASVRESIAQP